MTYEGAVVVAVDEGEPYRTLLRWAALEATARDARLVVCHVCEWQPGQQVPRPVTDAPVELRIGPERVVATAVDVVRSEFPDLRVEAALGVGNPVRGLLAVSQEARMVVVGARGIGGFSGLLTGSVAVQLAEHAHCPVAVIRPGAGSATDVVVGVDGSTESRHALRVGLDQARRAGGRLIAVHAYRLPPVAASYGVNPGSDVRSVHQLAEETLASVLGDAEAINPDVKIERRVEHGPTARVLLDAAEGSAALVVGARGLGGFAGLIAGSVSQQVLRHAHCPTVVVH